MLIGMLITFKTYQSNVAYRCALFLVDRDRGELISHIADKTAEIRFSMSEGIAGHVATTGEVINTAQAYEHPKFNPEIDKKSGINVLCHAFLVLINRCRI